MSYPRVELRVLLAGATDREKLQQGWSPQCEAQPAPAGDWAVLKTTAVQPGSFLASENKRLPEHLTPRPGLEVAAGDILLTNAGPRARCGVATLVRSTRSRLMISGKLYRFRVAPDLMLPEFLELFLLSEEAQRAIDAMKTGISDSGLNLTKSRFLALEVPVPLLTEQRRIVDLVEDHLSRLDAAVAGVGRATARVRALEASTLAGFTARSSNVQKLRSAVAKVEAGKSFGGSLGPASAGEWGIIKVSAMTWGEYRPSENKRVDPSRANPRFEIHPGDVLLSRANTAEYVGASVFVRETPSRLLLSDKSLRLVPMDHVDPEWLQLVLSSPAARAQISARATGTKDSMRNISQRQLLDIELPVATQSEQREVLSQWAQLRAATSSIRTEAGRVLVRSASLRRALLAAAFSGRLTGAASDVEHIEEMALA